MTMSNITALSFWGADTFLPDTIFEWIIFVLLVLAVIILARQFAPKTDYEMHLIHAKNKNHH